MEFLVHHPVADDVLDVVGHHRQHVGAEIPAECWVPHGGEGAAALGNGAQRVSFFVGWRFPGGARPSPSASGWGVPGRGLVVEGGHGRSGDTGGAGSALGGVGCERFRGRASDLPGGCGAGLSAIGGAHSRAGEYCGVAGGAAEFETVFDTADRWERRSLGDGVCADV